MALHLKDYYSILELPPSASLDEVKKAYRRLALQYHPDKTGNDPYAAARFTEIKEAYEIMTHPVRKEHYLQQRWYAQSIGKPMETAAMTPVLLLKKMLDLDKYARTLDIHRMDHEGLFQYITYLLSHENISMLNSFRDETVNKEIIRLALKTGHLLTFPLVKDLSIRLGKIKSPDEISARNIDSFIRQHERAAYWEKQRIWVVLAIVIIVSIGIFLLSE